MPNNLDACCTHKGETGTDTGELKKNQSFAWKRVWTQLLLSLHQQHSALKDWMIIHQLLAAPSCLTWHCPETALEQPPTLDGNFAKVRNKGSLLCVRLQHPAAHVCWLKVTTFTVLKSCVAIIWGDAAIVMPRLSQDHAHSLNGFKSSNSLLVNCSSASAIVEDNFISMIFCCCLWCTHCCMYLAGSVKLFMAAPALLLPIHQIVEQRPLMSSASTAERPKVWQKPDPGVFMRGLFSCEIHV